MAKKDKYSEYRDVIYYMAAQMELDRNNLPAAQELLIKASKYNSGNLNSRSKSFLMIADLAYDQKKYIEAAAFYDSINVSELKPEDFDRVQQRKSTLSKIVNYNATIKRQDSLQRIAALPEEERTAYINKLLRRMLKEQGLSDAVLTSGNLPVSNKSPIDLFARKVNGIFIITLQKHREPPSLSRCGGTVQIQITGDDLQVYHNNSRQKFLEIITIYQPR